MTYYFKGLDSLRAIAALVVVIGHIELFKANQSFKNSFEYMPSGHIAVVLFFVLSGFLITFLLVKEKEKNGRISLKHFYLRRIFRIWPLYYLIIVLSIFVSKGEYTAKSLLLCLTIFPNIAHALGIGWQASPQIWSIGVEEQFYLFWPIILILLPKKIVTPSLIAFIVGYTFLPHAIDFTNMRLWNNNSLADFSRAFFFGSKFNSMAIGSLIGYLYANNSKYLKVLYFKPLAWISIILSFGLWMFGFEIRFFTDELFSILFAVLILNLATNKNLKFSIDNKVFSSLGKISYGIYMYHWIVILFAFKILDLVKTTSAITFNILLYLIVLSLTIGVSYVSFYSYEKFFLNLKSKFASQ